MEKQKISFENPTIPYRVWYTNPIKKGRCTRPLHSHNELEFIYITAGSVRVSSTTYETIGKINDILFIDCNIPHSIETLTDDTAFYVLQLKMPFIAKPPLQYLSMYVHISSNKVYCFSPTNPAHGIIKNNILSMNDEQFVGDVASTYFTKSYAYAIIGTVYRDKISSGENNFSSKETQKLLPVLEYINNNYDENLTLDDLSKKFNLNKIYFCRLFKAGTGLTFTEYLNWVRICEADTYFSTDISITEISNRLGFSSVSYFNRIFNKYKGCSPSYYKKLYSRTEPLYEHNHSD